MEYAISINTMEEYINELTARFGFAVTEEENVITFTVPEELGTGYMQLKHISDDIDIGIMDLYLKTPLVSYYDSYNNTCSLTYCLAGHIDYSETGVPGVNLGKNQVGVFAIPRTRGMMMIPSGERVLSTTIASGQAFQDQLPYARECEAFEEEAIQNILCRMARPANMNAKLHNHFERIMENQMQGTLKNTYLDSLGKVMLSDIWQECVVTPMMGREQSKFGDFEHQALLDARDIVKKQYLTPPTIQTLAKCVALNEYALKTGFKQLFGKSIYEYARSVRMENARYLLENSSLSIGQIASMVGYVNTSHFARAFRGEYGMNPKDFRIGF